MKMEMQQRLTALSITAFLGFGFLLLINGCKNSKEADIGHGKTYFINNCSACHGRLDGFKNAPSLLTIYNYDSLILIDKLKNIKQDDFHKNLIVSQRYSIREIHSVYKYIKENFEPQP